MNVAGWIAFAIFCASTLVQAWMAIRHAQAIAAYTRTSARISKAYEDDHAALLALIEDHNNAGGGK